MKTVFITLCLLYVASSVVTEDLDEILSRQVSGLVHWWSFDGNTNDVISDLDAFSYNISFIEDRDGKPNQAIDITNGYLALPEGTYMEGSYSISFWLKLNDESSNEQYILEFGNKYSTSFAYDESDKAHNYDIVRLVIQAETLRFYTCSAGNCNNVRAKEWIDPQTWTHVTITFFEGNALIYLNGVFNIKKAGFPIAEDVIRSYCAVGANPENYSDSSYRLHGAIDDLKIFNRALSAGEVLENMSGVAVTTTFATMTTRRTTGSSGFNGHLTNAILNSWGFPKTRNVIDLSDRRITSIDKDTFKGYDTLHSLHLEDNEMTSIEPNLFDDLVNLNELWLSSNRIMSLPQGLFKNLDRLDELRLKENNLIVLEERALNGLKETTILDFRQNKLVNVHFTIFLGLTKLRRVYFSGNSLLPGIVETVCSVNPFCVVHP